MQNVGSIIILLFIIAISLIISLSFHHINSKLLVKSSKQTDELIKEKEFAIFDIRDLIIESYPSLNKTIIEFTLTPITKDIKFYYWVLNFIKSDNNILYKKFLFSNTLDELNNTYVLVEIYSKNITISNTAAFENKAIPQGEVSNVYIEITDAKLVNILENLDELTFRLYIYPIFQDIRVVCQREYVYIICEEVA